MIVDTAIGRRGFHHKHVRWCVDVVREGPRRFITRRACELFSPLSPGEGSGVRADAVWSRAHAERDDCIPFGRRRTLLPLELLRANPADERSNGAGLTLLL